MSSSAGPVALTVYYDGLCRVCAHEISIYRKRDREARVRWVDIMDPHFSALTEGLDPEKVHVEMHAKRSDGSLAIGVEAFVEIWKVVPGFAPLAKVASQNWMKPVLRAGYRAFTRVRPYLPRKAGGVDCEDGSCAVRKG